MKWLVYFRPMLRGRFSVNATGTQFDAPDFNRGTTLFGGRFWQRIKGGYFLYQRDPVARTAWQMVGRADGGATTITAMPGFRPRPDLATQYCITVVGAGGVESVEGAARWLVTLDSDGQLVVYAPNPPLDLTVEIAGVDSFQLSWFYDEDGQRGKPIAFDVFNDIGTPGDIDLTKVIATVPYRLRRGHFSTTLSGFATNVRVGWQLRARNADGAHSGPSATEYSTIGSGALAVDEPFALP